MIRFLVSAIVVVVVATVSTLLGSRLLGVRRGWVRQLLAGAIGWLVALPYGVSVVAMILVGRSSDKRHERRWHVAIPALLGAVGLAGHMGGKLVFGNRKH